MAGGARDKQGTTALKYYIVCLSLPAFLYISTSGRPQSAAGRQTDSLTRNMAMDLTEYEFVDLEIPYSSEKGPFWEAGNDNINTDLSMWGIEKTQVVYSNEKDLLSLGKTGDGRPSGYSIEQDQSRLHSTGVVVPAPEVGFEAQQWAATSGIVQSAQSETPLVELVDCEEYLNSLQTTEQSGINDDADMEAPACTQHDKEAMELMSELMDGDDDSVSCLMSDVPSTTGVTISEPQLPMFEPQQLRHQWQAPNSQQHEPEVHAAPRLPTCRVRTNSNCSDSSSVSICSESQDVGNPTPSREAEITIMADYIKEIIGKGSSTKPEEMSSKLKVHEVILTILLNWAHGNKSVDLRRILAFCDGNGRECSTESSHFKTLDTETMGLLWQKIKGNKKANYDTFARAMRVRREKSQGYFDYLDGGKRSKKRIYRFGEKTLAEMARMKQTLRQFSEPNTCGY